MLKIKIDCTKGMKIAPVLNGKESRAVCEQKLDKSLSHFFYKDMTFSECLDSLKVLSQDLTIYCTIRDKGKLT